MSQEKETTKSVKKTSPKTKPNPNDGVKNQSGNPESNASKIDYADISQPPYDILSENLTKAAIAAQKAMMISGQNASQMISFDKSMMDPFHVAPAFNKLVSGWIQEPQKLINAQTNLMMQYSQLWESMSEKAIRFSNLTPEASAEKPSDQRLDKRFSDPSWHENPVFEAIKNSYLVTSQWLNDLAEDNVNLSHEENQKIKFITKLMTNSFAPSEFFVIQSRGSQGFG